MEHFAGGYAGILLTADSAALLQTEPRFRLDHDKRERAVIDRDLLNARNAAEASRGEDVGSSRRGTRGPRDS